MQHEAKTNSINLVIKFFLTLLVSILAVYISVSISSAYYEVAPFHWDSASYLLQALNYSDIVHQHGIIYAITQALHQKDSLDLTLRILFAQSSLQTTFGHMIIAAPFMALFIFLILHYTHLRTKSWLMSLTLACSLFIFPIMYLPYMGIADYWKESIAIWIFGSVILTWLLSKNLSRISWAALCSILLGLLVMERTVLAIYAAFLFLPLVVFAIYERFKNDNLKLALQKILIFIIPALVLALLVLILQYKLLYSYYFVIGGTGHGGKFWEISYFLMHYIRYYEKFPMAIIAVILILSLISVSNWKLQYKDFLIALWFTLGFPALIILMGTYYEGFYMVWCALLVILLATAAPISVKKYIPPKVFSSALLLIIVCSSITQYFLSQQFTTKLIAEHADTTVFFKKITNIMMQEAAPRHFSLFFDEIWGPYFDYIRLIRKIPLSSPDGLTPVGYMSVHDNYYMPLARFSGNLQQFEDSNIQALEKNNGTLAFTYCDPVITHRGSIFGADANKIAIPYVEAITNHLLTSLNWKVIDKINDSYYGCIYVFRYSKEPLSKLAKWESIR